MTAAVPPLRGFMDGIDFLDELGRNPDGVPVYPSADRVVSASGHSLVECGIAEVEVRFVRWVKEPKYD